MRRLWIASGAIAGLAFIFLLARFISESSNPVVRESAVVFSASGGTVGGYLETRDAIRFNLDKNRTILQVASKDPDLRRMLDSARDAGESINVRGYLAGAHFDRETGEPVFWLQSLEYRGKEYGPYPPRVPWSWRVMVEEQLALLTGIALQGNQDYVGALREFDLSLANEGLKPSQRALALAMRGAVYQRQAFVEPTTVGRDYLLMRAVENVAAAEKLRPDDSSLLTAHAELLTQLGGQEEAIKVLERVPREPAGAFFDAGVMKAEILRRLHRYPEALSVLDAIPQNDSGMGMMYHYHRGVTLLLLERHPEAAAAFTSGLKSQRGWQWAYIGRACARHFMGDAESAVADLRTALEIADRTVDKEQPPQSVIRAELRNNLHRLEIPRENGAAPLTICERFDPDFDGPARERSRLLDAN